MRTLHPRGVAGPGVCVDAEGAMIGPDCVLVRRTSRGYHSIDREDACALQKCLFNATPDQDWLFRQCQRIADALDKGEVALAQIYGLRIPVDELDDRQLRRIALAKTNFNPDEPRVPKGDPHGGEWTIGGGQNWGRPASDAQSIGVSSSHSTRWSHLLDRSQSDASGPRAGYAVPADAGYYSFRARAQSAL
jgi:hypothetical protein